MAAPPTKIMIIRHAEKPPKPPNNDGPWDVLADGQSGSGQSLIVQGWQRAGALNAFFAPYQAVPANPAIATPDFIYAGSPGGESRRPCETVTPLAAWLNYEQDTPKFNTSFKIGSDEAQMVQSALRMSGVALICWEHKNIMPHIMQAIDNLVPIANFNSLPAAWPNVFYLVWVLDLNGGEYVWSSHNQNLIAGDAA